MNRAAQFNLTLALLLGLAAVAPAGGQAPPGPLPPKPGVAPEKAPPQKGKQGAPIRVQVNLVSMPVTVRDAKGELVFDLAETDFHVFDNGSEQKIEHFDMGGDPLDVVLLVETSSRIEALLPAIRQTGIVFTQTVMARTAEAAVMGFDDTTALLLPFTTDQNKVEKIVNKLPEGTSGVRLYDALSKAVGLLKQRPEGRRRVIVAMSEAGDSGSETPLGVVLREAQLANVAIYTIGLSSTAAELRAKPSQAAAPSIGPPGTFPLPPVPGTAQTPSTQQAQMGNINVLALAVWIVQLGTNVAKEHSLAVASEATGGAHVNTFRDRSIEQAMDRVGGELHAQYMLGYRPQGDEPSGYHEIKVTVDRSQVKVRTRPGYYLAPPAS